MFQPPLLFISQCARNFLLVSTVLNTSLFFLCSVLKWLRLPMRYVFTVSPYCSPWAARRCQFCFNFLQHIWCTDCFIYKRTAHDLKSVLHYRDMKRRVATSSPSGSAPTRWPITWSSLWSGLVQAVLEAFGLTNAPGTTTRHLLICGYIRAFSRGWRHGPCRLRDNVDDDYIGGCWRLTCILQYFATATPDQRFTPRNNVLLTSTFDTGRARLKAWRIL